MLMLSLRRKQQMTKKLKIRKNGENRRSARQHSTLRVVNKIHLILSQDYSTRSLECRCMRWGTKALAKTNGTDDRNIDAALTRNPSRPVIRDLLITALKNRDSFNTTSKANNVPTTICEKLFHQTWVGSPADKCRTGTARRCVKKLEHFRHTRVKY